MAQAASSLDGEILGLGRLGAALAGLGDAVFAPVGWLAAIAIRVVSWRLRARLKAVDRRFEIEDLTGGFDRNSLDQLLRNIEVAQCKLQETHEGLGVGAQTIGARILKQDLRRMYDAFESLRVHVLELEAQIDIASGHTHTAKDLKELFADLDR